MDVDITPFLSKWMLFMIRYFLGAIVSLFVLCQPIEAREQKYQYDLSFCMIFQNDAQYLKEWIEFHRLVGGQHFYLYNNLSTDNYQEVLAPYISEGIVELFDWPYPSNNVAEWDAIQVLAYQDGWSHAKTKTKWLAILDSDEFLFPVHCDSLVKFLSFYEKIPHIGGVCVNWMMYGTSNVDKIPDDKLLIETLVFSKGEGDRHYKSIVRPDRVAWVCSPHYSKYKEGYCHCTPSNGPVVPPFVEIDLIRINHYWSRDEWYLNNVKIPRRELWGTPMEASQLWGMLGNAHYDPSIFRFIGPLRKRVFGQ
jgi:Glycosyltransferase family 92